MRVVVDTNVWVSALVFGGNPRKVFEQIISRGYLIVVSEELLSEIRRVISGKFPDFAADLEALVVALGLRIEKTVLGAQTIKIARDPKDNMVLETAIAGGADYIISGDDDLLSLKKFKTVKIVSPANFSQSA